MRSSTPAAATWLALGVAATVLVVGLVWLLGGFGSGADSPGSAVRGGPAAVQQHPNTGNGAVHRGPAHKATVPDRVVHTLSLVDAGQWPAAANAPGTLGGRTFRNNEGRLPRTDSAGARARYQEWDVNPKAPGRSRDAERIITGADGAAWYSLDHYRSFHQIRGPQQ